MRKFKAESQKLLDLMINSIYTNKEIFLREIISNASDAIDKLYFKSLTDRSIQLAKDDLRIVIDLDKDERTLTVRDYGIGMDKDDLDQNLSTIAHSGSLDFKTENSESQGGDIDIIGQFGVGFYSAFMVAKEINVISKPYGSDQAWKWTSKGVEGYTIEECEKDSYGTDVILTMKMDDSDENYSDYLEESTIRMLVRKYSNYVRYPIQMETTLQRAIPKPDDAPDDYKTQYEEYTEIQTLNSMTPIWKKSKSEVTDEEYSDFYKLTFHDYEEPARVVKFSAEGALSYDALLYIPSRKPWDYYTQDFNKGLALYSSGVMIMERCEDLVPDFFNFVRGVVDSPDLNLNISRETLQQDKQLRAIEKHIEKKIKAELLDILQKDRDTYEELWGNFGRVIKYGIYSSYGQRSEFLGDILLFYSAKQERMVTLDEYKEYMAEGQESIYYAAGDSRELLQKMPIVKTVLRKGYDVLLCTEDVDEFCFRMMREFNMMNFVNVASGEVDFEDEDDKKEAAEVAKANSKLLAHISNTIGGQVSRVTISSRLTDEPVCLVSQGDITLEMEKVYNANPGNDQVRCQRVLEFNPNHKIFEVLKESYDSGDIEKVDVISKVLFDQCLLMEGLPIEDPVDYSQNVYKLMEY